MILRFVCVKFIINKKLVFFHYICLLIKKNILFLIRVDKYNITLKIKKEGLAYERRR